jgi:hypothetical protein
MRAEIRRQAQGRTSAELWGWAAVAAAVIAVGTGMAALLPHPQAWEIAAAYLAPASLAFVAYWWNAQKL